MGVLKRLFGLDKSDARKPAGSRPAARPSGPSGVGPNESIPYAAPNVYDRNTLIRDADTWANTTTQTQSGTGAVQSRDAAARAAQQRAGDDELRRILTDDGRTLMRMLPQDVSMDQTCQRFPHIVNKIADAWRRPNDFARLMSDLLIDDRGGRQGFPFEVAMELTELREYYFTYVHPVTRSVWGQGGRGP